MVKHLTTRWPPILLAILLQVLAMLTASLFTGLLGFNLSGSAFALLCGVFAALFSLFAGMERWWMAIQLLFLPAMNALLLQQLPPYAYLLPFLLLLAIYWSTFRSRVPLYLSSKRVWQALEEVLPPPRTDQTVKFLDSGAGIGGLLLHLSIKRPDVEFTGVENAPLPYWLSKSRIVLSGRKNCHIHWQSLWDHDFSAYDVVYAYLSPVPMEKLWLKVQQEMRPGTLFVSNTFKVQGHPADYSITLEDLHRSTLYVWEHA